jgi:hypothetical protein
MDISNELEIYVDDVPKGQNWYSSDLKAFLSDDRMEGDSLVLRTEGYVGNRPLLHKSGHHEDDTWAIDVLTENGDAWMSFLYCSDYEYTEDVKRLNKYI